ncbi:MAG: sialate O-acetylesterase [Sedimentisphaerales bacterium]|nr:sialate O-acetylesterase [Sedimentisphaerales bacterium]
MKRRELIGVLLLVLGATGSLWAGEGVEGARETLHLYLLAGQSNMAGRGVVAEQDKTIHPRVFTLDRENRWVPAREPLHFDKPAYVGVGPGLAFGKALAEADPNTTIGLIPCAAGGSPITAWKQEGYHAQTKSHPYDDAVKRCRIARRRGVLKGVLWHQGESDSNPQDGPLYAQRLTDLIANLRRDLQSPDLLFVAGTPADAFIARKPETALVTDAIKTVAKADENVFWVSARGLKCKSDQVHFNAEAARELGRRYAEAVLKKKNIDRDSRPGGSADTDSSQ